MIVKEIFAKFGFKTDEKALSRLEKNLTSIKRLALGVSAGFTAVGGTLLAITKSTANYADEIGESAQKIGISTDALQKFRYSAKLSGLSAEELSIGMKFLSKNFIEAKSGSKEASKAFSKMKDLDLKKVKSTEDLLLTVANHFSKMKEGAEKTTLSLNLFGRSGSAMIPMLNKGENALLKQWQLLEKLGGVLSEDVIKAGDKFMDSWDTMTTTITIFKNIIGAELMPVVQKYIDSLIEWYAANKDLIQQNVKKWMHRFLDALVIVKDILISFGEKLAWVIDNLIKLQDKTGLVTEGLKYFVSVLLTIKGIEFATTLRDIAKGFGLVKTASGEATFSLGLFSKRLGAIAIGSLGVYAIVDALQSLASGEKVGIIKWASDFRDYMKESHEWLWKILKVLYYMSPVGWVTESIEKLMDISGITNDIIKSHLPKIVQPINQYGFSKEQMEKAASIFSDMTPSFATQFPAGLLSNKVPIPNNITNHTNIDLKIEAPAGANADGLGRILEDTLNEMLDDRNRMALRAIEVGGS